MFDLNATLIQECIIRKLLLRCIIFAKLFNMAPKIDIENFYYYTLHLKKFCVKLLCEIIFIINNSTFSINI